MILPLLDLDETRVELAAVEDDLDRMDTIRIVDQERHAELRTTRLRWRDRLADQIAQLEACGQEQASPSRPRDDGVALCSRPACPPNPQPKEQP